MWPSPPLLPSTAFLSSLLPLLLPLLISSLFPLAFASASAFTSAIPNDFHQGEYTVQLEIFNFTNHDANRAVVETQRKSEVKVVPVYFTSDNSLLLLDLKIYLAISDINLSGLITQWHNYTEEKFESLACHYFSGALSDAPISWAAFTLCPQLGLSGFVYLGNFGYSLLPFNSHSNSDNFSVNSEPSLDGKVEEKSNLINDDGLKNRSKKKRSARRLINLTDDAVFNELEGSGDENLSFLDAGTEDFEYFSNAAWKSSEKRNKDIMNPIRWLEIVIAVDDTLVNFHGKSRVEQYVLTILNIVNVIYQHETLDANMQLVLKRLIFIPAGSSKVIRLGNAKKSLENVNEWNRNLHESLQKKGKSVHDVAVWLTRSYLGGPSGYAPVGGCCDPQRSCALTKDEGLTSAFIIAHEMAHILGLTHDGDANQKNSCKDEAFKGSVMAPMVSSTFHHFLWSDCSRKEFLQKSRNWKCLLNPPTDAKVHHLNSSLGAFSMDEQCRVEFGEGYSVCKSFEIMEPCAHLWCGHMDSPLVCKTKKSPPLEGTACGPRKWCIEGYCEKMPNGASKASDGSGGGRQGFVLQEQKARRDGGWSAWGLWGYCSRSCGIGVQFRDRNCDNPRPNYLGRRCEGPKEEWQVCNTEDCPLPLQDYRAQQCGKMSKLLNFPTNLTWLPYESHLPELKCRFLCQAKETGELHLSNEHLVDGTRCSYDDDPSNICVQGKCENFGCDLIKNSLKAEDNCGICDGNNIQCIKIHKKINKNIRKKVSKVVTVHRMARQINITLHLNQSVTQLLLKDRRRNIFQLSLQSDGGGGGGNFSQQTPTRERRGWQWQIIHGAKFHFYKNQSTWSLWCKGPLLTELIIMIAKDTEIAANKKENANDSSGTTFFVSAESQYYLHKSMLNESEKYEWIPGGWGSCSKACGGGTRYKTTACWDRHSNRIVPRKHCSIVSKPSRQSEICNNFSCKFTWIAGPWESCSSTCGNRGQQQRQIYCVPQTKSEHFNDINKAANSVPKFTLSPDKCHRIPPPPTNRICARTPCPGYLNFTQWTNCSSSSYTSTTSASSSTTGVHQCNRFSFRELKCFPFAKNETLFTCLEPTENRIESRKCNEFEDCEMPCLQDESSFCKLGPLKKYCKIKGFREMCCKSCKLFWLNPVQF